MLTRSLEGQKKVETYYYIRKQVFEYDEVMNNQRRYIPNAAGCWMAVPSRSR